MKFTESLEAARLRAGAWLRERKERAAERKAIREMRPRDPHGHSRFWLLNVPATATIMAATVEWYWALLFCIQATGAVDWNYSTAVGSAAPATGAWNFSFSAHLPVLIGLVFATAPIVMISMVWLPVQFTMRGAGRWRRGTMIAVGLLANVLVIVSGTVVMNHNRQEQVRAGLVVEQSAEQGRAAIGARLSYAQEQLRLALSNANPYLNQAANVGAAEWERSYVAQARAINDPRLPQLERALGAARRADQLRADIERLTVEQAQATPAAATAAHVEDRVGVGLNTFAQMVEVYRPPFIAMICTLVGVFGAWWVTALLEGLNPRDVLRSGWADEGHRIEDHSAEAPLPVDPEGLRPPREVVTDAETGEELVKIKPREYWRRTKGKRQRVEIQPEVPPDERGVEVDGGERIGSAPVEQVVVDPVGQQGEADNNAQRNERPDEESADESVSVQPEPPSEIPPMTDEEIEAWAASAEEQPSDPVADPEHDLDAHLDGAENEQSVENPVDHTDLQDEPAREPETNPARLLAAAE